MFCTKKRGRNKEKEGEEIRNFGQNIYPRIEEGSMLCDVVTCGMQMEHELHTMSGRVAVHVILSDVKRMFVPTSCVIWYQVCIC